MSKEKVFIIFVTIFLTVASLCADDSSTEYYPQSGNVFPVQNDSIRMVSEKVLYKDGKFTTEFHFKNLTDKEQIVTLAYPVTGTFGIGHQKIETDLLLSKEEVARKIEDNYQFHSYIDGKEVKRELKPVDQNKEVSDNYSFMFTTEVKFAPFQEHLIVNTYHQDPVIASDVTGASTETLTYILKTGKYWNSTIEKAEFEFFVDKNYFKIGRFFNREDPYILEKEIHTEPITEYKEEDNYFVCSWDFNNLEPEGNITITALWRRYSLKQVLEIIDLIEGNRIDRIKTDKNDFFIEMTNKKKFAELINAILDNYRVNFGEYKVIIKKEDYEFYKEFSQFAVNSFYALKGYDFQKKSLKEFYKLFPWYITKPGKIILTREEETLIKSAKDFDTMIIFK